MNAAFIPVRGGSKSIPLKNIKEICGKPLVYWTLKAACDCAAIDKVYVATDSPIIRETVESFHLEKAVVIGRSAESASDTASTEFAMLEFAQSYSFDNVVLIQATSPLLTSADLDRGFDLFASPDCDSVLSAVPQKRFYWSYQPDHTVTPVNYDVYHRPRRQEFDGYLTENGAFYITSRADLLRTKNRVSGRIMAVEMCEDSFFEIDEPSDWLIIEALMKKNGLATSESSALPDLSGIKMFLTDSDGCLTDGGMYYTESGDEFKKFHALDGKGLSMLREHGIICGIITGEDRQLVARRAEKLHLEILEMGISDKLPVVLKISETYNIPLENICYVGDDLPDIPVIKAVGFGCSVANALPSVKCAADYVTSASGGTGAIREIADMILESLD